MAVKHTRAIPGVATETGIGASRALTPFRSFALNRLFLAVIACLAWSVTAFWAMLEWTALSLIAAIFASIATMYFSRLVTNKFFSLITLFAIFHVVYGIAGPLSFYLRENLALDRSVHFVDTYILFHALSSIGLIFGMSSFLKDSRSLWFGNMGGGEKLNGLCLSLSAIVVALFATASYLVHILLAGGIQIALYGKAFAGMQIGQLTTSPVLPSLSILSAVLLGLSLSQGKQNNPRLYLFLIAWLLLLSPVLYFNLIIGERGALIFIFLSLIVSYNYYRNRDSINKKTIFLLVFLYLFSSILFAFRAFTGRLILGEIDFRTAYEQFVTSFVDMLDPAKIEFGATFVNFNNFMLNKHLFPDYYLGETYVRGLVSLYLYFTGSKPVDNITLEFNYLLYPEQISQGTGMAFSSILEAYLNFGLLGVPGVYMLIGMVLAYIEKLKYKKISDVHAFCYGMLVPTVVAFHRSNFGITRWLVPVAAGILGYMIYSIMLIILRKR